MKEFTNKWDEFFKNGSKQLTELSEVNANTLTNWLKEMSTFNNEATKAKKSEDFFALQLKFANLMSLEAMKYSKEVTKILFNSEKDSMSKCSEEAKEDSSEKTSGH